VEMFLADVEQSQPDRRSGDLRHHHPRPTI
jgi:hypothetical protein